MGRAEQMMKPEVAAGQDGRDQDRAEQKVQPRDDKTDQTRQPGDPVHRADGRGQAEQQEPDKPQKTRQSPTIPGAVTRYESSPILNSFVSVLTKHPL